MSSSVALPPTHDASARTVPRTTPRRRIATAGVGLGTVVVAGTAALAHLWWGPYLVGFLAGGLASWGVCRLRHAALFALTAVVLTAALPLVIASLSGQPVIATAEATLSILGIGGPGELLVVAALAAALLLVGVGLWLGCTAGGLLRQYLRRRTT